MELVTGKAGYAHITSAQLGAGYSSIIGEGKVVAKTGSMFAATVLDANTVRIGDGDAWMDGRHVVVERGTYEDLVLESGISGRNRNDLVVIRYTRDQATGIESAGLAVVKGEPASGAASDPAVNAGSIADGLLAVDMPLWRIPISGITPGTPVRMFTLLSPMQEMKASVDGKAASGHAHAASAITSGILPVARGGTGAASAAAGRVLAAPSAAAGAPSFRALAAADIPNLPASKIASGTLGSDRIPNLPASKIASGTLSTARLATTAPGFTKGSWTPSATDVRARSGLVSVSLDGQVSAQVAAWTQTYLVGTMGVRPACWTNLTAVAQIGGSFVPVLCGINTEGRILLRNAGTAIPSGTWIWIGGTYISA